MDFDVEQVARINTYVKKFNKSIEPDDEELLVYSIEMAINRALLYLNHTELSIQFERIVADIVGEVFSKYKKNINQIEPEIAVASVSDNGQSISYSNEIKTYFSSASDKELFGGFINLMSKFRRANVVVAT